MFLEIQCRLLKSKGLNVVSLGGGWRKSITVRGGGGDVVITDVDGASTSTTVDELVGTIFADFFRVSLLSLFVGIVFIIFKR